MRARLLAIALAILSFACSKQEGEQKKDPWLAAPSTSAARAAAFSRYRAETRCEARVELPAREANPKGTLRVCRGELDIDLLDLQKTQGSIAIDLGSMEMDGDADGGGANDATRSAQNWLDLGSSRPEAERERLRWATFTLTSIEELSTERAAEGKRVKSAEPSEPDSGARTETRNVTFTAKGNLQVHGVRVDVSVPMTAAFHYPEAAAPDVRPDHIELTSRRPLSVSLGTHEIKPRNSQGVVVSADAKLLGASVGRDARVSISVSLRP